LGGVTSLAARADPFDLAFDPRDHASGPSRLNPVPPSMDFKRWCESLATLREVASFRVKTQLAIRIGLVPAPMK